jgi:hypothetical protein
MRVLIRSVLGTTRREASGPWTGRQRIYLTGFPCQTLASSLTGQYVSVSPLSWGFCLKMRPQSIVVTHGRFCWEHHNKQVWFRFPRSWGGSRARNGGKKTITYDKLTRRPAWWFCRCHRGWHLCDGPKRRKHWMILSDEMEPMMVRAPDHHRFHLVCPSRSVASACLSFAEPTNRWTGTGEQSHRYRL